MLTLLVFINSVIPAPLHNPPITMKHWNTGYLLDHMSVTTDPVSFKQLKLELQNWLKIEIWGPLLKSLNLKIDIFSWEQFALRWRVIQILRLDVGLEPWRSVDPRITRFENRIILFIIDLKWMKNRWRWIFPSMVSIEKL